MKPRKVVYLAHPISGDISGNLKRLVSWYRWAVMTRHVNPIAPYHLCCLALNDQSPNERELGIELDEQILRSGIIEEVWLVGSMISRGMSNESRIAMSMGIEVRDFTGTRLPPPDDDKAEGP